MKTDEVDPPSRKILFWTIASSLGSLLILCSIALWVGSPKLTQSLSLLIAVEVSLLEMIGILISSATVWLLRSFRLSLFVDEVKILGGLYVCGTHNALTRILPFRTGELSLPLLLNQHFQTPLSEGGLLMVWLRLLEVSCLVPFILLALIFYPSLAQELPWLSLPVLISIFGASIMALWGVRPLSRLGLKGVAQSLRFFKKDKVAERLDMLIEVGRKMTFYQVLGGAMITMTILCAQTLLFYQILLLSGAQISLAETALGSVAVHLAGVLPAPTIGSVGAHEAGWVIIYQQLGLPTSIAILSALLSQWVTLGLSLIWWMLIGLFKPE